MAKDKVVSFVQARKELSRIVDEVGSGGVPVVVTKRQKPVAVVIGIDRYRQMTSAGKTLVNVKGKRILKLRGLARADEDISQAIKALRKSRIEAVRGSI